VSLEYLQGYPPGLLAQVRDLIDAGRLAQTVAQRPRDAHAVRTERALYDYVIELKARQMNSAPPLAQVAYDPTLHIVRNALRTHSTASGVQGVRLQATRAIRIAALFKEAPADFLRVIVIHESAHLKEREDDKAFVALCLHMEPVHGTCTWNLHMEPAQ